MIPREKLAFVALMSGVAETYGKKLSTELLEVYWRTLDQFSFEKVSEALQKHLLNPDNGQFMPKPADVVRMIYGDTQAQALRAWTKVTSAIRSVGMYESIVFDDRLIHVVIQEMQGWVSLCNTKEEKFPFVENEFLKRYAANLIFNPKDHPRKLVGMLEHKNNIQCLEQSEPCFYGDLSLARQVYETGKDPSQSIQIHKLSELPKFKENENVTTSNPKRTSITSVSHKN